MNEQDLIENLTTICHRLGVPLDRAKTVALQMEKRSRQLAQERNIKQAQALDYLLSLLKSAQQGDAQPNPSPQAASNRPQDEENCDS